jgi:hypothetical protein
MSYYIPDMGMVGQAFDLQIELNAWVYVHLHAVPPFSVLSSAFAPYPQLKLTLDLIKLAETPIGVG